jgi:hypothetical protein
MIGLLLLILVKPASTTDLTPYIPGFETSDYVNILLANAAENSFNVNAALFLSQSALRVSLRLSNNHSNLQKAASDIVTQCKQRIEKARSTSSNDDLSSALNDAAILSQNQQHYHVCHEKIKHALALWRKEKTMYTETHYRHTTMLLRLLSNVWMLQQAKEVAVKAVEIGQHLLSPSSSSSVSTKSPKAGQSLLLNNEHPVDIYKSRVIDADTWEVDVGGIDDEGDEFLRENVILHRREYGIEWTESSSADNDNDNDNNNHSKSDFILTPIDPALLYHHTIQDNHIVNLGVRALVLAALNDNAEEAENSNQELQNVVDKLSANINLYSDYMLDIDAAGGDGGGSSGQADMNKGSSVNNGFTMTEADYEHVWMSKACLRNNWGNYATSLLRTKQLNRQKQKKRTVDTPTTTSNLNSCRQIYNSSDIYFHPNTDIVRVDAKTINKTTFEQEFLNQGRPVLVTNFIQASSSSSSSTPSPSPWKESVWNLKQFVETYKDQTVLTTRSSSVATRQSFVYTVPMALSQTETLNTFVKRMHDDDLYVDCDPP